MGFKHFMSTSHIDIYLICKYLNILNVKVGVGIPFDTFKKPDTSDDTVAESLMCLVSPPIVIFSKSGLQQTSPNDQSGGQ